MARSVASSLVSSASLMLSGHAKLDSIASDRALVEATRNSGHRIVSASRKGGYGDAGAWAIVHRVEPATLQKALESQDIHNIRAEEITDDAPLWHVIIEDMLGRSRRAISTYLLLGGFDMLREQMFDLLVEPVDSSGLSADDVHLAVRTLEPLLKVVYDQAKTDSKWKGQMAYHQLHGIRRTLLNFYCDSDEPDLVKALLDYTDEALCSPSNPRKLVIEETCCGSCEVRLVKSSALPDVAISDKPLIPGEVLKVGLVQRGDGDIVIGVVSRRDFAAAMPGSLPDSLEVFKSESQIGSINSNENSESYAASIEIAIECDINCSAFVLIVNGVKSERRIVLPAAATSFLAIGLRSSGALVKCSKLLCATGSGKPWMQLADVCFGHFEDNRRNASADQYGNNPFHCCAYAGAKRTLSVLLEHVYQFASTRPALKSAMCQDTTLESRFGPGKNPVQTANQRGRTDCAAALSSETVAVVFFQDARAVFIGCAFKFKKHGGVDEKNLQIPVGRPSWDERFWSDLNDAIVLCGVGDVELAISGLQVSDGDGAYICHLLEWSRSRLSSVIWTRTCLSLADFLLVLQGVLDGMTNSYAWKTIGLGMRPLPSESDSSMELARAIRDLIVAMVKMPLGSDLIVRISPAWLNLLPEEEKNIIFVLHSIPALHSWWKQSSRPNSCIGASKKNKAAGANPLSANPFMSGLCRIKDVTVGSSWQRLVAKNDFNECLDEGVLVFLRLSVKSWACFLNHHRISVHTPAELELWTNLKDHLRTALNFVEQMRELARNCETEMREARASCAA